MWLDVEISSSGVYKALYEPSMNQVSKCGGPSQLGRYERLCVWAWLFCCAPVGGHRPLAIVVVPLLANLR